MNAESIDIYHYPSLGDIEGPYQQELHTIVNTFYLRNPEMQYLLALSEHSEEFRGVAAFLISGRRAELKELFVDEGHRRQGIGTMLLEDLQALEGIDTITLHVLSDNKSALALYKQARYETIEWLSGSLVMRRSK